MIKWAAPFDPDETKYYSVDWGPVLVASFNGDLIVNSPAPGVTFTVNEADTGLGVVSSTVDATQKIAVVWFSATDKAKLLPLAGTSVTIDHTITTEGGVTLNETVALRIKAK